MKTRETKKQEKPVVILSEATDGVNKVRLLAAAAEEEEACPWEEIDAYSGRFVVAGYRYGTSDTDGTSNNYHPWLAYSIDGGKTWTKNDTTTEEDQPHGRLYALAYGGGRFVVAGYRYGTITTDGTSNNYHPWLAYSTDGGKTWTPSTTTADDNQTHGQLYALAYGGGRFVVAGYRYTTSTSSGDTDTSDDNHPWLAYSTDGGETWTASTTTADTNQPHGELRALAYGGGRFVVAGYRYGLVDDTSNDYHPWLAYSTDGGKTWTKSVTTAEEDQPHGELYALAYGGGRFVVAGYQYGTGTDGTRDDWHPWLAYSIDGGETWTTSTTTSDTSQPHGRLYALAYGGGRFVVAGYRYTTPTSGDDNDTTDNYHPWLAYSADGGKTWTRNATTTDTNQPHGVLRALAYAPDTYCWKFGKENDEEDEDEDEEENEE